MVVAKSLLVMFLSLSAVVQSAKLNQGELRSTIKRAMERCGVPGMGIAVLHKNKVIFADGFGKRNEKDPYTPQVNWKQRRCSFYVTGDGFLSSLTCTNRSFFFALLRNRPSNPLDR